MPNLQEKNKTILLAKPDGLPYLVHIKDVVDMVILLRNSFPNHAIKYESFFNGDKLYGITKLAARYHDEGKLHDAWQKPCQKDYQAFLEWKDKQKKEVTPLDFERECRGIAGANIRVANFRHEIGSLVMHGNKLNMRERIAIAAHHGKLALYHEAKWSTPSLREKGQSYYDNFRTRSNKGDGKFSNRVLDFLKFSGPRAMLQIADRGASAMEGGNPFPSIIPFEYTFPNTWKKREVQQIAEANWGKDLLVFRAPTGAGKTDAALLWAKKQIDSKKAQRLVIAMPTRFTSTALAISTENSISEVGLYHSSSKFVNRAGLKGKTKQEMQGVNLYSKWLMPPVTVCTIDHLLMALTLTREDHHITTFNFANSCLVIDEADAYDDFIRQNIAVLLKACKIWKVPVMVMSASIPDSELSFFQDIGYDIEAFEEDTSEYTDDQCVLKSFHDFEIPFDIDSLLNQCIKKETAIIYVNTVDRAVELYKYLKKMINDIPLLLYHSRFLEKDKREKEEAIIKCLGKKAWENGNARGIVILTQIGEMSINISAELMLTELCPIDRLVQRIGRLSRFKQNKSLGELHLLIPKKKDKLYPPPYGNFERRKGWIPSPYLTRTRQVLKLKTYKRGDWVKLINEVYNNRIESDLKAKGNSKKLEGLLKKNWLVRMTERSSDDDTGIASWQARDIDPQRNVLVIEPPKEGIFNFKSWSEYYHVQTTEGMSIPVYLAEKGLKQATLLVMKLKISGEEQEEKIFMVNPCNYSIEFGLSLAHSNSIF